MSANSFGNIFKISSFGESHGPALGVVIDGCPAGVVFDESLLLRNLVRRRPGQSVVTTQRNEADQPEVLSGVFEGKTLGTPICMIVRNTDQRSEEYKDIAQQARIGHADDTWKEKFGHVDHRGGGRSSGRETLSRVLAGSVAEMFCRQLRPEIQMKGYASQIAHYKLTNEERELIWNQNIDAFMTRMPSKNESAIINLLENARASGESYGGIVELQVRGLDSGLGQPVFKKLKSDLAAAMLSLGAVAGFEFGEGFSSTQQSGQSFHTDLNSDVYGGIRGGISTGEPIRFQVAFKPTSSIKDVAKKGRHDPCIVTRAVPVVEAMTWIVLADHFLWKRLDRI